MLSSRRLPEFVFGALAVALLVMTLTWQIPMMLWDHLNLVPMVEAWRHGDLANSAFFRFDGGHMHTAAYAVLLIDADLTSGHPWLDDCVSWALLIASAALIMAFIRDSFPAHRGRRIGLVSMLVFLTLYPGHLANLQWGWQVAVFLCLLGVTGVIYALTRAQLSWWNNGVALAGAALAYFSFATAIAIFPIALLLLALRRDYAWRTRLSMAIPWMAACVALVLVYRRFGSAAMAHDIPTEMLYVLDFVGAGISRFATDLAAPLAVGGIVLAVWAALRSWRELSALPWIALALFGFLAGVLVALGRATELGANQAFVSRYVSFSSLFWLGLFALLTRMYMGSLSRGLYAALIVVSIFACGNALQLMHRARDVGARTQLIATTIHQTWPRVNDRILSEIYFDKPRIARLRLEKLHAWGYAPFPRVGTPAESDRRAQEPASRASDPSGH